uniref:FBA_2 domain-containing protein n=1 Tax=Caenorhabditis tropicalis TaxID=1561998 RepID=A0A1I7UT39_9PELO
MISDIFTVKNVTYDLFLGRNTLNILDLTERETGGKPVVSARFSGDFAPLDTVINILNQFKWNLEIDYRFPDYFQFDFEGKYSGGSIKIPFAHWLTLQDLLAFLHCDSVHLENVRVSGEELNVFLSHFIRNSATKRLFLTARNVDLSVVIQGITVFDKGVDWFEIRRENGSKAEIEMKDGVFCLRTE